MNYRRPFALSFLLCATLLFALSSLPIAAQTATATLSGTVTDQNGAVVPNSNVTIVSDATGLKRDAVTNDEGYFTVPLLQPGTYTVRAQHDGFKIVQVDSVVLNVGDQKTLQLPLQTGTVSETVNITGDAPLINESPAVATVIDRKFVGNLPLNGRSFQSLILLTPGVVIIQTGSGDAGQFSVNGQRNNANYFTVDGVSANTGVTNSAGDSSQTFSQKLAGTLPNLTALGTTASLVSIDALEEFKLQTSTYSAEFGRQPGGQVQLVTRSGTNQFHGTVFDYFRNDIFDARNWFNKVPAAKPPLRQNQFGGTFSGPVRVPGLYNGRNKTFFFASYEGLRLRLPVAANTIVPSLRLRQLTAPALRPFMDMISLPTGPETTTNTGSPSGFAPFVGSYSSPSSFDATSVRLDHIVNSKLTLFGRYSQTPSSSLTRVLMAVAGDRNNTHTITIGTDQFLTPRLNNQLRANWTSSRGRRTDSLDNFGGAVPIDPSLLLLGYNGPGPAWGRFFLSLPGQPKVIIADVGTEVDTYQRQINLVDNISWVRGAHQFKFGFDYRRLAPTYGPSPYNPSLQILSQAGLTSGTLDFFSIVARQGARPRFDNYSLYAQDSWRTSRRLTLDLGLRWELNPAPHDADGKAPAVVAISSINELQTATLSPSATPFYRTLYTAFAPRVGFSYQLRQTSWQTMLRGGFGVYYDLGTGEAITGFGVYPFVTSSFLSNVPFPVPPAQAQPPGFPTLMLPTNNLLYGLNPNLVLPYTLQWNFALQQSLGGNQSLSLSYVASAGRRLLTTQRLNQIPPGGNSRPNPNFGNINYTYNGPTSNYQALQAQFQRRLSHGLQALVNYTWSHAIDEVSSEIVPGTVQRGNANFDVRHNFNAAISYDVPRFKAGPVLSLLFRDWSLYSVVYAQSGQPFDVVAGQLTLSDGTQVSIRPDRVPGMPFWINDPAVPGGRKLNRAAFQLPPFISGSSSIFARQGTLGRNVITGKNIYQLNMALGRKFNLSERWYLQFKWEVFNVFNHPQFSGYNTTLSSGTFGIPTSTLDRTLGGMNSLYQIGGARSMQFSMKLGF